MQKSSMEHLKLSSIIDEHKIQAKVFHGTSEICFGGTGSEKRITKIERKSSLPATILGYKQQQLHCTQP